MRSQLRVRVAHTLLVIAGLVAITYALALGGSSELRCRGAVMAPGSVCLKADGSAGQTYEQRLATRRAAQPIVVGVGIAVAAFGAVLLVSDLRRKSPVEHAG